MRANDDGKTVAAMDVLVPSWRINGRLPKRRALGRFGEENRGSRFRERIVLVVFGAAKARLGPAQRLWFKFREVGSIRHRRGEYQRCDCISSIPRQRGLLK